MLDSSLQMRLDGPLTALARRLAAMGVRGELMAGAGFALGFAAAVSAASGFYPAAILLLVLNRLFGALEKAIARAGEGGDFSFYLATSLDMVFWGAFVLAFAFAQPEAALVAAILLFALMALAGTALAFALTGVRSGLGDQASGQPLTDILSRLIEETEVVIAFVLMCLFPGYFAAIAVLLALAALTTAGFLTLKAWRVFRP